MSLLSAARTHAAVASFQRALGIAPLPRAEGGQPVTGRCRSRHLSPALVHAGGQPGRSPHARPSRRTAPGDRSRGPPVEHSSARIGRVPSAPSTLEKAAAAPNRSSTIQRFRRARAPVDPLARIERRGPTARIAIDAPTRSAAGSAAAPIPLEMGTRGHRIAGVDELPDRMRASSAAAIARSSRWLLLQLPRAQPAAADRAGRPDPAVIIGDQHERQRHVRDGTTP